MSVYGTGRIDLNAPRLFLRVWLPALSARPKARRTFGFQSPYVLKRGIPSPRGSVTTRSSRNPQCGRRNIDRLGITCPCRVRLSSRLTLIRLAWFRKPWVFGVNISIFIVVTHAYIFVSGRSRKAHASPSTPTGMLPYHTTLIVSSASATVLMPDHHPRDSARLVSCYALFE